MDFIPVGVNWDKGFQSDIARDQLAANVAFRMVDWIPQLDAPLTKRGGWTYGSPSLASLGGSAINVQSVGFLPFPGDGRLAAISNGGSVYLLERFDGSGGTLLGDTGDTSIIPTSQITWHKTGTLYYGIVCAGLNQAAPGKVPKKILNSAGYTVQALGGTPPLARWSMSWGDYLILGNYYDPSSPSTLYNYRIAFSAVGNPDSWTLTGVNASTVDFPEEIVMGVYLRNGLLFFGYNHAWIVTGDTPPPGGNLSEKILWGGIGTLDGRSVKHWRDFAVWANSTGIFQSDGATLTDLTETAGIGTYYRSLVAGFTFSQGWSAVAGLYRNHYKITLRNGSGTLITTLVIDLERQIAWEENNINANCYAEFPSGPGTALYGGGEELFFAHAASPFIGKTSSLWLPTSANAADADGTAVTPRLETGYYRLKFPYKKRIRGGRVTYDIRTAGASPSLALSATMSTAPDAAYTAINEVMTTSTQQQRLRYGWRKEGLGIAFKVQQVGPSALTRIYQIEIEGAPQDPTRK